MLNPNYSKKYKLGFSNTVVKYQLVQARLPFSLPSAAKSTEGRFIRLTVLFFYCPKGAITGISAAGASTVADGASTVAAAVVAGAGEAVAADGTPGPTSLLLSAAPVVLPGPALPEPVVLSGT